jgi:hypothetical protein
VEVHEEVSKEKAAMETFEVLKKQYGDRYIAIGRRPGRWWVPEMFVAVRRGLTGRAIPAPRKGHVRSGRDVGRNRNATTA